MDFRPNSGSFLGSLFEQADFVKITLPPTREPQSAGSGGSETATFFHYFVACVLGASVLHEFSITLGPILGPI